MTGEQPAQRVGCSISTLRKLEAGESRPSLQIAELLANALDLAPAVGPTFLKVARRPEHRAPALSISRIRPAGASGPASPTGAGGAGVMACCAPVNLLPTVLP